MRKKLVAILALLSLSACAGTAVAFGVGAWAAEATVASTNTSQPAVGSPASGPDWTAGTTLSDEPVVVAPEPVLGQDSFDAQIDKCMAAQGLSEELEIWREQDFTLGAGPHGRYATLFTDEERAHIEFALWGNSGTGAPWDWETTGCDGYAEHTLNLEQTR